MISTYGGITVRPVPSNGFESSGRRNTVIAVVSVNASACSDTAISP